MGNVAVIKSGDIQVMSAGTGITHSEYNKHKDRPVKFLQIWLFPNKKNVQPRYDQMTLTIGSSKTHFKQIVSAKSFMTRVWIQQNARFYLSKFDNNFELIINWRIVIMAFTDLCTGRDKHNGISLNQRDSLGLWDTRVSIKAESQDAELLLMELPNEVYESTLLR